MKASVGQTVQLEGNRSTGGLSKQAEVQPKAQQKTSAQSSGLEELGQGNQPPFTPEPKTGSSFLSLRTLDCVDEDRSSYYSKDGPKSSAFQKPEWTVNAQQPQTAEEDSVGSSRASEDMYAQLFHSPRIASSMRSAFKSQKSHVATPRFAIPRQNRPTDQTQVLGTQENMSTSSQASISAEPASDADTTSAQESTSGHQSTVESLPTPLPVDADAAAPSSRDEAEKTSFHGMPSVDASHGMKESTVPSSRLGRVWQYSGLATSMAFGAVSESFRRVTSGGSTQPLSPFMSEANLSRLVSKLSRMRGAALKLGQMLSFQGQTRDCPRHLTRAKRSHRLQDVTRSTWRGTPACPRQCRLHACITTGSSTN